MRNLTRKTMEPGCYLLLAYHVPPLLATVTSIGASQIEYEQTDDDRLKRHNTWGKYSAEDFINIGSYNQQEVFGCITGHLNLEGLRLTLQECKDKMLENENARLAEEKRKHDARLAQEKRKNDARLAQEKREQEARLAQERVRRIRELLDVALNLTIQNSTLIKPGIPEENDQKLANTWISAISADQASEETRMLSARMAEKAVIRYLSDRGEKPEDIAVLQLSGNVSLHCEWKSYDIRTGATYIDVKNARRSEQNPHAYVSHCVPRFKASRDGTSVLIAGTLSKWLPLNQILNGDSEVRFLGTTSAEKLGQLRSMMASGQLRFSVDSLNTPKFLPSWIFDYSPVDYKFRDEALREISKCFSKSAIESDISEPGILPALLAAGQIDADTSKSLPSPWMFSFISCMNERLNESHYSLSVVFLTILEHFLSMLADNDPQDYSPNGYKNIIFYPGRWKSPLFLCDPEFAINSLIESLATLWQHRDESLLSLKIFQLHQLNVLSGKRDEHSPRQTVLAYCGGWKTESGRSRPCGMTPLVYGKHESCSCGKLICPKCGFCSKDKDCPECKPRQSKLETLRNSLLQFNPIRTQ